jgi:hypothetical protein
MGPRASLDIEVKGKTSCLGQGSNLDRPVVVRTTQLVSLIDAFCSLIHHRCPVLMFISGSRQCYAVYIFILFVIYVTTLSSISDYIVSMIFE